MKEKVLRVFGFALAGKYWVNDDDETLHLLVRTSVKGK